MTDYLKITHRDIAKMLCKALPVEGEDYRSVVESYIETIRKMPNNARLALKVAYVFSRKVPREEAEDLFQDLALAVLQSKAEHEKLAYTIARFDWINWWGKYKIRQHLSLDSVAEDTEGNPVALRDLIVGEVEFERKVNGKMDADRIWDKLPDTIKPIIEARLMGKAITRSSDRMRLNRWIKAEGYKLLMA